MTTMTFVDLLRAVVDNGRLLEQLDEEMAAVIRGTIKTGLQGELTLKLSFLAENDEIRVAPKVTTKIPSGELRSRTFFVTVDGELTRAPEQQPLFRAGAHA